MPPHGNHRKTPHEQRYTCVCTWCGLVFASSRELANTCSAAHRQALSRYVRRHGSPPASPPAGPLSRPT